MLYGSVYVIVVLKWVQMIPYVNKVAIFFFKNSSVLHVVVSNDVRAKTRYL